VNRQRCLFTVYLLRFFLFIFSFSLPLLRPSPLFFLNQYHPTDQSRRSDQPRWRMGFSPSVPSYCSLASLYGAPMGWRSEREREREKGLRFVCGMWICESIDMLLSDWIPFGCEEKSMEGYVWWGGDRRVIEKWKKKKIKKQYLKKIES
jgi:hypothetical protein